jgi:hypothetical protein
LGVDRGSLDLLKEPDSFGGDSGTLVEGVCSEVGSASLHSSVQAAIGGITIKQSIHKARTKEADGAMLNLKVVPNHLRSKKLRGGRQSNDLRKRQLTLVPIPLVHVERLTSRS